MTKPKGMSLDEFLKIQKDRLKEFEKYWRENNKTNPGEFPMDMAADNAGTWFEMFQIFDD